MNKKALVLLQEYDLIVLDVDGTLVETASGETFRKKANDWRFLPGVYDACRALVRAGKILILASNQGGVCFSWSSFTEAEIRTELDLTGRLIGAKHVLVSCFMPTNPKALPQYRHDDGLRKPSGGMIVAAMELVGVPAKHTLMVGDRDEDEGAACAAGVGFLNAAVFFALLNAPEEVDPIFWAYPEHKEALGALLLEYKQFDREWIAPLYLMSSFPGWNDKDNITKNGIAFWHILDQSWSTTELILVKLAANLHNLRIASPLILDFLDLDDRQMRIATSAIELRRKGWDYAPLDMAYFGRVKKLPVVKLFENDANVLMLSPSGGVYVDNPFLTGANFAEAAFAILTNDTADWSAEWVVPAEGADEALKGCQHIATYTQSATGGQIEVHCRPGRNGEKYLGIDIDSVDAYPHIIEAKKKD